MHVVSRLSGAEQGASAERVDALICGARASAGCVLAGRMVLDSGREDVLIVWLDDDSNSNTTEPSKKSFLESISDRVQALLQKNQCADAFRVDTRAWNVVFKPKNDVPLSLNNNTVFGAWCEDRQGAKELRKQTRPTHLKHIEDSNHDGLMGAFPAIDGDGAVGSLLLVRSIQSISELKSWTAADPYAQAGVFQSVELFALR
mmetsp:Transcript_7828/g.16775  ORF Transcript_7828/g.16775 Transcript_7828/m.16775 type:complete len:202 (-) Transcript_7828:110-715(-)